MKTCTAILLLGLCFASLLAKSKLGSVEGTVRDNGVPIKGTIVKLLRAGYTGEPNSLAVGVGVVTSRLAGGAAIAFPVDAPGMYHVHAPKNGHYIQAGLPVGLYSMAVEVDGVIVERVSGVKVEEGKRTQQDFDISKDQNSK